MSERVLDVLRVAKLSEGETECVSASVCDREALFRELIEIETVVDTVELCADVLLVRVLDSVSLTTVYLE